MFFGGGPSQEEFKISSGGLRLGEFELAGLLKLVLLAALPPRLSGTTKLGLPRTKITGWKHVATLFLSRSERSTLHLRNSD